MKSCQICKTTTPIDKYWPIFAALNAVNECDISSIIKGLIIDTLDEVWWCDGCFKDIGKKAALNAWWYNLDRIIGDLLVYDDIIVIRNSKHSIIVRDMNWGYYLEETRYFPNPKFCEKLICRVVPWESKKTLFWNSLNNAINDEVAQKLAIFSIISESLLPELSAVIIGLFYELAGF
jgi:hypothetical protein